MALVSTLTNTAFALHFFGKLFEDGCNHSTGTTAVGVEVDNDGQTGLGGVLFHESIEFCGEKNNERFDCTIRMDDHDHDNKYIIILMTS
jgi:hypothetical protein